MATEVDTNDNGGDFTTTCSVITALCSSSRPLLSDPARRAQFSGDLRRVTEADRRITRTPRRPARPNGAGSGAARAGSANFTRPQTTFGHNLKSYENDHEREHGVRGPPVGQSLDADRAGCGSAPGTSRRPRGTSGSANFTPRSNVVPDSEWWIDDEADQLPLATDLHDGFASQDQLAASAQSFLDVFVDRDPFHPARETFTRGSPGTPTTPTSASRSSARTCSTTTSTR